MCDAVVEFTPVVGARYRVTDRTGRKALVFVNGPPHVDSSGTRSVPCQAEELEDEHGHKCPVMTHSEYLVIDALQWTLLEEATPENGANHRWLISSLFGLGSGSFPASIRSR